VLCGQYLLALCVSFAALTLSPRAGMAQTVVRPHASVLWVTAAGPPQAGASRSMGPVQERNALIGTTLRWGVLGGALGTLIGATTGS